MSFAQSVTVLMVRVPDQECHSDLHAKVPRETACLYSNHMSASTQLHVAPSIEIAYSPLQVIGILGYAVGKIRVWLQLLDKECNHPVHTVLVDPTSAKPVSLFPAALHRFCQCSSM